jgi:hypothetical protein
MMKCDRCSGRVFIDRVFSQKLHIELFCILCGRRWMINRETNRFGRWLSQREENHKRSFGIFS